MKRKDGKTSENQVMIDLAAMEGMDIDDSDSTETSMKEVSKNSAEKFELPDICDTKFWNTEIKFMTDEHMLHCGKLKDLKGGNHSTQKFTPCSAARKWSSDVDPLGTQT